MPPSRERDYRVTWEIDLPATSKEEAAQRALDVQRDPASGATLFKVQAKDEDLEELVDLGEGA